MTAELIDTYRAAAHERLPESAVGYYDGGSGDGTSLREAGPAWSAHRFRPHVLRDVSTVTAGVEVLGSTWSSPVAVAPSALHVLAHPDGEVATARAAAAAGVPIVVSTRSSRRLEDVGAAAARAGGSWWFQAYVMRDRDLTLHLVRRAAAAGAAAVVLTGDTPAVGRRARSVRFGLPVSDEVYGVNLATGLPADADLDAASAHDPSAGLAEIDWLARAAGLPVLVKGVLRGDDALGCLDAGAAGVIVSNHGGRQLDRAVAPAVALPGVVRAVAGRGVVLADGGVRSALDVLAALALGARAVLIGRPVLWALAAAGPEGVRTLLEQFRADLVDVLRLAGCNSPAGVGADLLAD